MKKQAAVAFKAESWNCTSQTLFFFFQWVIFKTGKFLTYFQSAQLQRFQVSITSQALVLTHASTE